MSSPLKENRKKKNKIKKAISQSNDSYSDFEKHLMQCENVEPDAQDLSETDEPSYLNITIQIKAPISPPKMQEFVDSFLERLHSASKSYLDDTDDIQVPRPIKVENFDDLFTPAKSNISDDGIIVPRPIKVENFDELFDQNCQMALPRLSNNNKPSTNAMVCDNNQIQDQIINNKSPVRSEKIKILRNEVLVSGNNNFQSDNDVIDRRFIALDDAIRHEINSIHNFMVFTASDTAASEIDLPVKKKCKRRKKKKCEVITEKNEFVQGGICESLANELNDADSAENRSGTEFLTVFELAGRKGNSADSGKRTEDKKKTKEDSMEVESCINKNQSVDILAAEKSEHQMPVEDELLGEKDTSVDSARKKKNKPKINDDSLKNESSTVKNQRLDILVAKMSENKMPDEDKVPELLTQKDTSADFSRKEKSKKKTKEDFMENESCTEKNQSLDILEVKNSEHQMPDEDQLLGGKDPSVDSGRRKKTKPKRNDDSLKNESSTDKNQSLDILVAKMSENKMPDEDTSADFSRKEKNKTKEDSMENESCTKKNQSLNIPAAKNSENQRLDKDELLGEKDTSVDSGRRKKTKPKRYDDSLKNESSSDKNQSWDILVAKMSENKMPDEDTSAVSGRKEENRKKTKEDSTENESCTNKNQSMDILSSRKSENQMPAEDELLVEKDTSVDSGRKEKNKTKVDSMEFESCTNKNQSVDILATKKSEIQMLAEDELLGETDTSVDSGRKKKPKRNDDSLKNESSTDKNQNLDILAAKKSENQMPAEDEVLGETDTSVDSGRKKKKKPKRNDKSLKTESSTDKNQNLDILAAKKSETQMPAEDEVLGETDTSVDSGRKKKRKPKRNDESLKNESSTDKNQSLDILVAKKSENQIPAEDELLGETDTSVDSGRKKKKKPKRNEESLKNESSTDKNQILDILAAKKSENQMPAEDEVLEETDTSVDSGRKKKRKPKRNDESLKNESSTDKNQSLDILAANKSENQMPAEDELLGETDTSVDSGRNKKNKPKRIDESLKTESSTDKNQSLDILAAKKSENQMLAEDELLGETDTSVDSGRKKKKKPKRNDESFKNESSTDKNQNLDILAANKSENQMLAEVEVLEETDTSVDSGRKKKRKPKRNDESLKNESFTDKNQNLDILAANKSENQMPAEDELLGETDTSVDSGRKKKKKPKRNDESLKTESSTDKNQSLDILVAKKSENLDEVPELLTQKDTSTTDFGRKEENKKKAKEDSMESKSCTDKHQIVDIVEAEKLGNQIELLTQKATSTDSGRKENNELTTKDYSMENERSVAKNRCFDILTTKKAENQRSVEDKMLELFTRKRGTDRTQSATRNQTIAPEKDSAPDQDDLFELLKQRKKQTNPTIKPPQKENIKKGQQETTTKETKKQTAKKSKNEYSKGTNGKLQEMVEDVISRFEFTNDTNIDKKSEPPVEDAKKEEEDINIAKFVAVNEGNAKPKAPDPTTQSAKPKKPRAPRKNTKKTIDQLRQATLDEVMHIPESIKNFFYGGSKVETPIIEPKTKVIKRNGKRKLDTSAVDMDLSKIANDKTIDKFLESLGVADQACDDVLIKPPEKYKQIRRTPAKGRSVQKRNHLEDTESHFSDATSTMSISDLFDFSDREMSPASKRKKPKGETTLEHIVQTPPRSRRYSRGERSISDYLIETPKRLQNGKSMDEDILKSQSEFFDDFDISSSINLSVSRSKPPGDDADVSLKEENSKRPEDVQGNHNDTKEGGTPVQEKNGVLNAFESLKQAKTNRKLRGEKAEVEKISNDVQKKKRTPRKMIIADSEEDVSLKEEKRPEDIQGNHVDTKEGGVLEALPDLENNGRPLIANAFEVLKQAKTNRKLKGETAEVEKISNDVQKKKRTPRKMIIADSEEDVSLKEEKRPEDIQGNHDDTKEGGVLEALPDLENNGSPLIANAFELLQQTRTNRKRKGDKAEVEKISNDVQKKKRKPRKMIIVDSEDQGLDEDVVSTIGPGGSKTTKQNGAHPVVPLGNSTVAPAAKQPKKKRKPPTKKLQETTKALDGLLTKDKPHADDSLLVDDADTSLKIEANSSSDYSLRMSLLRASDFEDSDQQSPKSEVGLHHELNISDDKILMAQTVKRKLKSGDRKRSAIKPKKPRMMVKEVMDDDDGSREELVLNFLERNVLLGRSDEGSSDDDDGTDGEDRRMANAEGSYNSSDSEEELSDELRDKFTRVVRNVRKKLARVTKKYKKLSKLTVKAPNWDVPPAHMIQSKIACLNNRTYNARCEDFDVKLRTSHFLACEDSLIRDNFRRFCERHDIEVDPRPFLTNTYEKKHLLRKLERHKFVQHLARDLDDRRLYCVFKRFQALMRNTNSGKFTAEEDAVILTYCKKFPKDSKRFWTLSHILNRPPKALCRRFVVLQTEKRKKLNLTVKYKKFIRRLLRITKAGTVNELKNTITEKHWSAMSKKYHDFPCWKLKLFWLEWVYPRLYSTKPIDREEILREIIIKFYDDNETDQRAIDWKKLAEQFENCTPPFLMAMFRNIVKIRVPVEERRSFRSVIEYLRPIVEDKAFREPFVYPVSYP